MVDYRYLVYSALTGDALDELPLTDVRYTVGMNGAGGGSAKISLTEAKANPYLIQTLAREIAVWRNGTPVQMGPITSYTLSQRDHSVSLTWGNPWFWVAGRTNELNLFYAEGTDAGVAVWDMVMVALGKVPGGDVNIGQSPNYPRATYPLPADLDYPLTSTDKVGAVVQKLASQFPGFDFDIELVPELRQQVGRNFNIYVPFKGTQVNRPVVIEALLDSGYTEDGTASFGRVTELSQNSEANETLVYRDNSPELVAGGFPMTEEIFNRDEATGGSLEQLKTWAEGDLFLHKWPHRTYPFSYKPSASLPFAFAGTGDTIIINDALGNFPLQGTLRVASYDVDVNAGDETVTIAFNDATDLAVE